MTDRWHSLGNISSPKLELLWQEMAATFARAVHASNSGNTQWQVLQPPTGSGKTQGLCVYAALTISKNRLCSEPLGILVVTRTIAQANEIGEAIKELADDPSDTDRVRASHSEAPQHTLAMQAADVLVITHEAYTRALECLSKEQSGRWEEFTTWDHGPRRLTIIDEALSGIVEENKIKAEDIRLTLGFIGPSLRRNFSAQVEALEKIREMMEKIAIFHAEPANSITAQIVWREGYDDYRKNPAAYDMGALRDAMASIRYDLITLQKDSLYDRQRIAAKVDRTLKDCEAIMRRWAYYYRKGKDDTFNSSQLLIPPGLPGPVVLDATASQNFSWRLLGTRANIAAIPTGTRNYANVKIHVARGNGVGKGKMTEKGKVRIPRLIANLEQQLTPDRKLLLCVHKNIEHIALNCSPKFDTYSLTHWGAVDGKNDWNDHDAVVIFGLQYRDTAWATNTFFALQGLQDNSWLEQPSWGAYRDVRQEMLRRQIAVSVIQAVNRVRCRRVIDAEGNCPPTDVFIVLPRGSDGDAILEHLEEEMPGAVTVSWNFEMDGPCERVRRGSSHEALLAFMGNRQPGETPMSLIRSELELSQSAEKDLRCVLRDDDHDLTKALAHRGVRYVTTGRGRGSRSYLLKR
ncbi:hypothetical protein C6Y62_11575 [Hyphomicrobium sulfonivorans]|nr:hypothetical protein [Hyphomicrobium sulfonivorans]